MAEHAEFREEFPDEHPQSYDHTEPRGSLLLFLIALTVVLLALTGIGIQYYYETLREHEVLNRVLIPENFQLRDLRNKEDHELNTYGYTDKATGTVRVPIERAMQMVAQEAKENRVKWPTSSYPVKTAAELASSPAVSQPGAAAAANASNQGTGSSPAVQPKPAK